LNSSSDKYFYYHQGYHPQFPETLQVEANNELFGMISGKLTEWKYRSVDEIFNYVEKLLRLDVNVVSQG
jgi:hypothetical protein